MAWKLTSSNIVYSTSTSSIYTGIILLRRRKLIGDYIAYRRLIVYYAVFENEGVVGQWL